MVGARPRAPAGRARLPSFGRAPASIDAGPRSRPSSRPRSCCSWSLTQLFLPGIGEGAIEDRLTEGGGVADVSLSATPAARLLWGSGDRIAIDATGLDLDLDEADPEVFENLDRFDEVEIVVTDSRAGPVEIEQLRADTRGRRGLLAALAAAPPRPPISPSSSPTTPTSPAPTSSAASSARPGSAAATSTSSSTCSLISDDGEIQVVEGGGEIAGIPTGPLGRVTEAILVRL